MRLRQPKLQNFDDEDKRDDGDDVDGDVHLDGVDDAH